MDGRRVEGLFRSLRRGLARTAKGTVNIAVRCLTAALCTEGHPIKSTLRYRYLFIIRRLHNPAERDKLRTMNLLITSLALLCLTLPAAPADLTTYLIDVEGGQSTLFVTPSGQSVLIDTGFPGFNGRDADRIAAVAKDAGVKQIDYLLITHYHGDHVGGVPAITARLPIRNFVDHGDTVEHTAAGQKLYDDYQKEVSKGKHIVVKPGDKLPVTGIDWTIVSAAGI